MEVEFATNARQLRLFTFLHPKERDRFTVPLNNIMSSDGKVGDDGLKLSSDSVGYVTGLLQQIAELQKNLEQTELKLGAVQVQRDMLNRLCQETQTVNDNLVDTNCSLQD